MATQPFNADMYKAGQRSDWTTAAAGWKYWWETIERALAPVSRRMIELAQIQEGQRVLDVATGIGEPALAAARLVGPSGQVTATDIAPGMLQIARERAQDAGVTNIEFVEMDAETLDFPEGTFHAVLCRFGLMFLPSLVASLQSMRRVLKDGGRLSASVWGPAERVPAVSVTMGAVARELQLPPPPSGTPGLFSLGDRSALEQSVGEAGFKDVQSEPLNITFKFDSMGDYVQFLKEVAAPVNNLLANQSEQRREDVWRAVAEANRQFVAADGTLHMEGESVLVGGRR